MEKKIQILYVDDEQDNLTGFKAAFRLSYHIYTAENAQAALSPRISASLFAISVCRK